MDLNVREYCTMCDLNFYGTLSSHRKSDKHQHLKTFLHPRCVPCAKEFPSRIEYDEHCLTPGHMINSIQTEEQKKSKKPKLGKGESEVRTTDDEEKDTTIPETKTPEKDDEVLPENTEYLTDILDDMDMKKYKIPSYKYCRQKQVQLGASMVKEIKGYHCEKCRRFMTTADDMAMHLKTLTHYKNFVAEVKQLTTPPAPVPDADASQDDKNTEESSENVEATKENSEEVVKKEDENEGGDNDDDNNVDDNSKRRKFNTDEEETEKAMDTDDKNDPEIKEKKTPEQNEEKNNAMESESSSIDVPDVKEVKEEKEKEKEKLDETINNDKDNNGIEEDNDSPDNWTDNGDYTVNTTVECNDDDEKIDNNEKIDDKKIITEEKDDDMIPEAPPAPIISTPSIQNNRQSFNNSKNNSPNMSMHTPNKSPRGSRGGFRGQRGQRARRSRR